MDEKGAGQGCYQFVTKPTQISPYKPNEKEREVRMFPNEIR